MDKISSIVSSKSQTKVDMSKERPVRAGAPSYGQPVSSATQTFKKEPTPLEVAHEEILAQKKLLTPDEKRHTGIIDKITLSFKGNPESEKPVEQVIELGELEVPVESESQEQQQTLDVYA